MGQREWSMAIGPNLPGDFTDRSDRLPDGYCLSLPSTRILDQSNRAYASIASAIRTETYIETCIWLADNGPKRLELISSPALANFEMPAS